MTAAAWIAEEELRVAARRFLAEVFVALERERVIPAPVFAPHVRVGRDYFGDWIRCASYRVLEQVISDGFPQMFPDEHRVPKNYPSHYMFSLVDAAVYYCTIEEDNYSPESASVTRAIDELVVTLHNDTPEVAACRAVTHLTTESGDPLILGDVTVTPAIAWDALRHIGTVIPGTGSVFSRDPPFIYDPPGAVIHVLGPALADPYDAVDKLSRRLERFLISVRLLTGASVQSGIEIQGSTSRVSRMRPDLVQFEFQGSHAGLIRRTARLSTKDGSPIEHLTTLVLDAGGHREGKLIASFDMALSQFNKSHQVGRWFDRLVDLATALEAALIGGGDDNAGILLRLKHRSATLLAVDNDPAPVIFHDVGLLYDLRSSLVHGGDLTEKKLNKILGGLSTIPADTPGGVGAALAVDRLRDLVRRALLARMTLGRGDSPLWPFNGDVAVDEVLADDSGRRLWRESWQAHISDIAGPRTAAKARPAADSISPDDK